MSIFYVHCFRAPSETLLSKKKNDRDRSAAEPVSITKLSVKCCAATLPFGVTLKHLKCGAVVEQVWADPENERCFQHGFFVRPPCAGGLK